MASDQRSTRVERWLVYGWLECAPTTEVDASRLAAVHRALLPGGPSDLRDLHRMWEAPLADGTSLGPPGGRHPGCRGIQAASAALLPRAASAERRRRMAVPKGTHGFSAELEVGIHP